MSFWSTFQNIFCNLNLMNCLIFILCLNCTFNILLQNHHMSSSFSNKKLIAIFDPVFFDNQNRLFLFHHFRYSEIVSNGFLQFNAVFYQICSYFSFDWHSITGFYQSRTVSYFLNSMVEADIHKVFGGHFHENPFPTE
jgi:hypothetical protein